MEQTVSTASTVWISILWRLSDLTVCKSQLYTRLPGTLLNILYSMHPIIAPAPLRNTKLYNIFFPLPEVPAGTSTYI